MTRLGPILLCVLLFALACAAKHPAAGSLPPQLQGVTHQRYAPIALRYRDEALRGLDPDRGTGALPLPAPAPEGRSFPAGFTS